MRKRMKNHVCVCHCEAGTLSVKTDARTLQEMIDKHREEMGRQSNVRTIAQRALYLGDLCEKSGYLMKAIEVWREAMCLVTGKDYGDLLYININNRLTGSIPSTH